MEGINEDEALKMNLINVVNHHKKYCEGIKCNIMLARLLMVGLRAGLVFTPEEMQLFK